jgi:hypothetical protein
LLFAFRLLLKCDGTRAETRFRLSAKRTIPFKSTGTSVQLNTGSRGVRISASNAGYTMFQGSVKSTGYPLHSPASPSLPLPCVTVCHHISTGHYSTIKYRNKNSVSLTTQLKKEQRALPKHCVHWICVRKVTVSHNTVISCHVFSYMTNTILQNNCFGEQTHTYAGAVVLANLCLVLEVTFGPWRGFNSVIFRKPWWINVRFKLQEL